MFIMIWFTSIPILIQVLSAAKLFRIVLTTLQESTTQVANRIYILELIKVYFDFMILKMMDNGISREKESME